MRAEITVQRKSLVLSIFLHCVIFCIIFVASGFTRKTSPPIIIDLTISPAASSSGKSSHKCAVSAPGRATEKHKTLHEKPRVVTHAESERRQSTAPVQTPAPPAERQVPENVPVGPTNGSPVVVKSDAAGTFGVGPSSPGVPSSVEEGRGDGSGKSAEQLKNGYLSQHFKYIRDLIQSNITYPTRARRMGWSGRVVVSFVIDENGRASQEKILQSSGFQVLDSNVIAAIKEVSPFPKPPVKAELHIPILYRLE
jgi:protein TonB